MSSFFWFRQSLIRRLFDNTGNPILIVKITLRLIPFLEIFFIPLCLRSCQDPTFCGDTPHQSPEAWAWS